MTRIRFPKFDANVIEGQVGAWLKAEGDRVELEEALVELITDKATFDLPSEGAGALRKIIAAEKSVVPVNYVIALIGEPDEDLPDVFVENQALVRKHREETAALEAAQATVDAKLVPTPRAKQKVRAKPAARRVAREAGVDLGDVTPADGKVVTEDDVRAFLAEKGGQT